MREGEGERGRGADCQRRERKERGRERAPPSSLCSPPFSRAFFLRAFARSQRNSPTADHGATAPARGLARGPRRREEERPLLPALHRLQRPRSAQRRGSFFLFSLSLLCLSWLCLSLGQVPAGAPLCTHTQAHTGAHNTHTHKRSIASFLPNAPALSLLSHCARFVQLHYANAQRPQAAYGQSAGVWREKRLFCLLAAPLFPTPLQLSVPASAFAAISRPPVRIALRRHYLTALRCCCFFLDSVAERQTLLATTLPQLRTYCAERVSACSALGIVPPMHPRPRLAPLPPFSRLRSHTHTHFPPSRASSCW